MFSNSTKASPFLLPCGDKQSATPATKIFKVQLQNELVILKSLVNRRKTVFPSQAEFKPTSGRHVEPSEEPGNVCVTCLPGQTSSSHNTVGVNLNNIRHW